MLDTNAEDLNSTPRVGAQRTFSPILETDDTNPFLDPPPPGQKSPPAVGEAKAKSKSSLKGSRVSFDQEDRFDETDEGFRKQREHFQKHKSHSTSEHKNQLIKVSLVVDGTRRKCWRERLLTLQKTWIIDCRRLFV